MKKASAVLFLALALASVACTENRVETVDTRGSRAQDEFDAFLHAKYHRDPLAPKVCWKYVFICRDCGDGEMSNSAHGGPAIGSVACDLVPPESIVGVEAAP